MRRHSLLLVCLAAAASPVCRAQLSDACGKTYIPGVAALVAQQLQAARAMTTDADRKQALVDAHDRFRQHLNQGGSVVACFSEAKALAGVMELRRIDKQTDAAGGTSGSTNLVPSGSVPALLGLAAEYGGVTQAFSGTTATFRTTPAKLIEALAHAYGPDAPEIPDATLAALERMSFSVSFDTSRTATSDTTTQNRLLANYRQLSQASGRILLINDRDPFARKNWLQIRDLSKTPTAAAFANASAKLLGDLTKQAEYTSAIDSAMAAYEALVADPNNLPDAAAFEKVLTTFFEAVQRATLTVPGWTERLDAYVASLVKLEAAHKALYRKIAKSPTLSLELVLNRPPLVSAASDGTAAGNAATPSVLPPDHLTASLVYTASLLESEYTLNAQSTFFTETRPDMSGNFRDAQFSAKWDIPVGNLFKSVSPGKLTFSGLYEHLHQKPLGIPLTINDQDVNQPGNMGVFQVRYSIPVGDSGVSIPISFTASNRTELIKEKEMRGNIGLTFDLDKLFAKQR